MGERPYTDFYASFLGGFSLYYQGERISISKRLQQKNMQLLLLLVMAGRKGVPRSRLLELLGNEGSSEENQMVNLRYCAFTLRRLIQETKGFPEGKYVVYKKKVYYFSLEYELDTDIGWVDAIYQKIRDGTVKEKERIELLFALCRIYTGEFLPTLAGVEWATVEGARYQRIYTECLNELCSILKEQKEYTLLLELCTQASQMYPYDNWQSVQIECLLAQDRYEEAKKIYEEASGSLYEDLGIALPPPKRQRDGNPEMRAGDVLTEIQTRMKEKENEPGAYWCSYPSFVDICRIVERLLERTKGNAVLLLCTLEDEAGRIPKDQEYTREAMEQLKQSLSGIVRGNDVCTRYSVSQFVMLLIGIDPSGGQMISERLKKAWMAERKEETLQLKIEMSPEPKADGAENHRPRRREEA